MKNIFIFIKRILLHATNIITFASLNQNTLLMKKIMFGNSLMLLGIAIMILAGLELIYIGIMWASFLLIPVGFIMAVIGFFSKDS